MKKAPNQVRLEDLAKGVLPKHLTDSIGQLKITVEELSIWNKTQSPMYIAFKQGYFIVDLRLRWSTKKLVAIIGGVLGLIWAIMRLSLDYLPKIKEWLLKT